MHHVIVTRVSISLCILFAACILGFAVLVNPSEPAGDDAKPPATADGRPDGEALFGTYCGRCHGVDELAEDLANASDPEARMAELAAFLESHGRASPGQDRVILQYLSRQR